MLSLQNAIQRAFDTANLIGESVDLDGVMLRYKAIRDLPDDQYEEIYKDLSFRLGFAR